ncbi:MAG: hypothetical protein QJR13_00020 [Bacillota bacterium]|nr:hypothetical protein [Bacillota bacterium]
MDVLITVNSPGEVAGWLRPVLRELSCQLPRARRIVVLPPCAFASGREEEVVASLPGVDLVWGNRDYLRLALLGRRPAGFVPDRRGVVLFLGGDLAHAVLLGRRLHWPVLAYTEGQVHWRRSFACFLVPNRQVQELVLRRGVPPERVKVIGNLIREAVQPTRPPGEVAQVLGLGPGPRLLILPGSRPVEFRYLAAFFVRVAQLLAAARPEVEIIWSLSPFLRAEEFLQALGRPRPETGGAPGEAAEVSGPWETWGPGVRAWRLHPAGQAGPLWWALQGLQYDLMAEAHLALTVPGTNTLEMAVAGLPMLVLLPLNKPEEIPVEGILEYVGRLPGLGRWLKRRAVLALARRMSFVSWPNRLAGRMLVPELKGVLTPEEVAEAALALLADAEERARLSAELRSLAGEPGAARRLVEAVREVLEERARWTENGGAADN